MKYKAIGVILLGWMMLTSAWADNKRYEVKSGIIEYTLNSGGMMMGVETKTTGTSKTVFKEWGAVEVQSGSSETLTMGQKERNHELTKLENGNVFVVDFDHKTIYKYTPELLADSDYRDLIQSGEEVMQSMGGKKIGQEDFMGYPCEIWEMMQVKTWIYKGIVLKSEANVMGLTHAISATKINFDTAISDSDLKLPDYPVKEANLQQMMEEGDEEEGAELTPEQMEEMQKMTKDDEENTSEPSPEQIEQLQEMMNNLNKI